MSHIVLPYMLRPETQVHITESYVSSPPAAIITDEQGDVWTLGFNRDHNAPRGEFAFDILRNGMPTGTSGSRIERRNNRIRAFTPEGWKWWSGTTFI